MGVWVGDGELGDFFELIGLSWVLRFPSFCRLRIILYLTRTELTHFFLKLNQIYSSLYELQLSLRAKKKQRKHNLSIAVHDFVWTLPSYSEHIVYSWIGASKSCTVGRTTSSGNL